MNVSERAMNIMTMTSMNESVIDKDEVLAKMKKMPKESWNSLMADIQGALDDVGKMIPTGTLDKALSKMVGR